MKSLPPFIASLAIALIILPVGSVAQNQRPVEPAPATLPGAETEVYKTVGDVSLPLHIFFPEGHKSGQSLPAIIFFFGGGWRYGSPAQFEKHCTYLASRGMVAITAEYRVWGRHKTKAIACFQDAKSAMRYVRSNAKRLGIDPNRIAAGGGSAGGHLAGALGTIGGLDDPAEDLSVSAAPNALCLFNPALILASIPSVRVMEVMPENRIIVTSEGRDRASASPDAFPLPDGLEERFGVSPTAFSPYHNIGSNQPPAIIFHGDADTTINHKSVELFTEKYKSLGNRCELVTYQGQGHGFFNFGRGDNAMFIATLTEMDAFLRSLRYLKGEPTIKRFYESIN